ncbi:MAG: hypothetical protein OSA88_12140 [Acidimicrobiales bacterium]|nr:hypothetical protein [Acidimicrobiales bacterium]
MRSRIRAFGWAAVVIFASGSVSEAAPAGKDCQPSPDYTCVETEDGTFRPDPNYEGVVYDAEAQLEIYGGKHMNRNQRPLLELGQRLYWFGPLQRNTNFMGDANPTNPQLMIFGDARIATAANKNGKEEIGLTAFRLNLDVDLRITATERFHAFFSPLKKDAKFTRCEFFLSDASDDCIDEFEPEPETAFFEGDLGAMFGGVIGEESPFDLPIAGGLVPLLFQNGIWVEDVFLGAAFTIPSRNSAVLDISNFDVTFFVGLDRVTSAIDQNADGDDSRIYGVTTFMDATSGYWEAGYGFTEDKTGRGLEYHNLTLAFTRRYQNWFSNSMRVLVNLGQDPDNGTKTANGAMFLFETSLITSRPSNVVPYLNLFVAIDKPQPLARTDGILKNTGILFESDALSGFPFLDDTGADSMGGALGIEILASDFGWQVVAEVAATFQHSDSDRNEEMGVGLRTQVPLTNALILRVNTMYGIVLDTADKAGATVELRYKF